MGIFDGGYHQYIIVKMAMTGVEDGRCCGIGEVDYRERHRISITMARTGSAITTGSEL